MKRLAAVLLLVGCGEKPAPADQLAGVLLPNAAPRPDFQLTTVDGQPFRFATSTGGRLTLLFFGYTNCPDVCPATVSILGAAMNKLTSEDRSRIDLVFVTTDPERDQPDSLDRWLRHFDRDYIGLTGTPAELEQAQRAVGVTPAIRDTANGRYTVSHAAQVIVYSPDDSSHIAYPFGTRQQQWVADLPILLTRWTGKPQ
jgi:protein SCO1/2